VPLQARVQGHDLMRAVYLHGFASSSKSSKATYFASRLAAHGVALEAPDLNEPDFSTLTVTRMLSRAGDAIGRGTDPAVVIGSSLGGFVAVQAALQHPERVTHVVLLAPALDFGGNRMRELGGVGLERWKATNRLDVFHYGYGRVMPVHYELYEDARRYDSFNARLTQPVQVFQGTRDDAVDPSTVQRWCTARPNVELHLLDDDHQLLGSLELIWREMRRFLSLPTVYQQIP
jgi:pimeloyl-ACP methyl ester carboxylesterase